MTNAYEQGWTDAERGKSPKDCPFHAQSGEAIAWRWGFRAMLDSVNVDQSGMGRTR